MAESLTIQTDDGSFQALVFRALVDLGGADHEACLLTQAENGVLG